MRKKGKFYYWLKEFVITFTPWLVTILLNEGEFLDYGRTDRQTDRHAIIMFYKEY